MKRQPIRLFFYRNIGQQIIKTPPAWWGFVYIYNVSDLYVASGRNLLQFTLVLGFRFTEVFHSLVYNSVLDLRNLMHGSGMRMSFKNFKIGSFRSRKDVFVGRFSGD